MVTVDLLDARGRAVPTANDSIAFRVSGAGKLIGVGNGDPNSLESDKAPKRALFNGLAQIIVQSTGEPGSIFIEAIDGVRKASPLLAGSLTLTARKAISSERPYPGPARRRSSR